MDPKISFTGVDVDSGRSLIPPLSQKELVEAIKAEQEKLQKTSSLRKAFRRDINLAHAMSKHKRGLLTNLNPLNLSDARWGLLYPTGIDPEVPQALEKLVKRRNGEVIEVPPQYFDDPDGFRDSRKETSGLVDPKCLPYYLLIVGSPDGSKGMTFRFQQRLSDIRPVGRLNFSKVVLKSGQLDLVDTPVDYEKYAQAVLDFEDGLAPPRPRQAVVFSTTTDPNTKSSDQYLAQDITKKLEELNANNVIDYPVTHLRAAQATQPALLEQIKSQAGVLFTVSHGLGVTAKPGDLGSVLGRQQQLMGALLTAEWDGKEGSVSEKAYLAGGHIEAGADLRGLVVFSFACYSAGVPRIDLFADYDARVPGQISAQAFVSSLPQHLLRSGALAFIGHVEKTWGYSYLAPGIGTDTKTFQQILSQILTKTPVGLAFETMSARYLDLTSRLSDRLGLYEKYRNGEVDRSTLIDVWMARQDTRAYIVLGDPFVSLKG